MEQARKTIMTQYQRILNSWQNLSFDLRELQTEAEYLALLEFTQQLTDENSVESEPIKTLFWLACEYLRRWEVLHDPWASQAVA
jgi:hypothetical protein